MSVATEIVKFLGIIGGEVCGIFLFLALMDCLHAVTSAAKAHATFLSRPIDVYWKVDAKK